VIGGISVMFSGFPYNRKYSYLPRMI